MKRVETLILAVSGGIDSVVMLDRLLDTDYRLVVAHFEHGMRGEESRKDADFVRQLADRHGLEYEIMSGGLGAMASEEQARLARYEFLRQVARAHDGLLCTAHHADDVIESVAINLSRGTGWRGLAVMGAGDIYRPLISLTKSEIYDYAKQHNLSWREDATNQSDQYLRNRLRQKIANRLTTAQKQMLYELYEHQTALRRAIEAEMAKFYQSSARYQRYFLIMIDPYLAQDILRYLINRHAGVIITRPQAEKALLAIKTASPGEILEVSSGVKLKFALKSFLVEFE